MNQRALGVAAIWIGGATVWACSGDLGGEGGNTPLPTSGSLAPDTTTVAGPSGATTRASATADASATASGAGGAPAEEVKVAFIGDSGAGNAFRSVLDLALAENADAIVHNGDFDYDLDPDAFFAVVDDKVGPGFAYFASVGNHDADKWTEYASYVKSHMDAVNVTLDDPDMADQKFAFSWKGLHFVFVGENGENEAFAEFIDAQLSAGDPGDWRICGWHKNQRAMQIGGKGDEMGWGVYEACREHGAIVTTGHEHSYERTKTLVEMETQTVDETCDTVEKACVSPGRTFAVVSGLGGVGIRDQERCLPAEPPYGCNGEWASIYASQQGATYGAFFIVFNVGGDPTKAHGYFKTVDGDIVDQVDIDRSP